MPARHSPNSEPGKAFPEKRRWKMKKILVVVMVLALGWICSTGVGAANPASSQALPAQVAQNASPETPPASGPEPTAAPPQKVKVNSFQVSGNTVVTGDEIQAVLQPYVGRELGFDEFKQAAQDVQKIYQDRGYFLAKVYLPPQSIDEGRVRLEVYEGRLGEVKIEGNKAYKTSFIQKYFRPTDSSGILTYEKMQRSLLLLNEFSDLKVKSVLQAGKEAGSTDVILSVEDKTPFHVGFDYNNFGNTYTGENRAGVGISAGNLAGQGDMIYGRCVFPFPSKKSQPFLQANYSYPMGKSGSRLSASFANAQMGVGRELEILDIRGEASIYGLNWSYPLVRTLLKSSDFSVGFTSKSIRNYILTQTSSRDELRELILSYSYNGISGRGRNFLNFYITQGLGTFMDGMPNGGFYVNDKSQPPSSRPNAGDSFTKFNLDLARIQQLGPRNFMILRASGQMASNPLVVGELYSLGGYDSVRGFQQSEQMGDTGFLLSAEFRMPINKSVENPLQGAIFFDTGSVSDKESQVGVPSSRSLTGCGAGLRFSLGENTQFRVDYGIPLNPTKTSQNQTSVFYGQFSTRF
jgi:hemolysin activation/secretion protein